MTGIPVEHLLAKAGAAPGANAVTFVSADGTQQTFPLGYVVGRHAVLSYEINDEDLSASVGGSNQLWMTKTPANYFVRDVVEIVVSVGKPVTFSGYAEDYGKQIVSVQFSLDNGANWTTYDVSDSTDDLWVHWTFSYTPERPGFYRLLVRSVNDAGAASPLADVAEFTAA